MIHRHALLAVLLVCLLGIVGSQPQAVAAEPEPSPKVQELLGLLSDPDVREWLATQSAKPLAPGGARRMDDPAVFLAQRLVVIRDHLTALAAAPGRLPDELSQGWQILRKSAGDRRPMVLLLMGALCLALGFAARGVYERAGGWQPVGRDEVNSTTSRGRLMGLWRRFVFELGGMVAFAAGAFVLFLLFDWPAPFQVLVLGVLLACLCVLAARLVLLVLLRPARGGEPPLPFRALAMNDEAANFWVGRITAAAAVFAFGWALANSLRAIGVTPEVVQFLVYLIGIGLLLLGLDMVWRSPRSTAPEAEAGAAMPQRRRTGRWALTLYFILIWLFWVAEAMNLFWFIVVAGLLPAAIYVSRRSVVHVFQTEIVGVGSGAPDMTAAILERGLRALFIVGAILVIAWGWNIDIVDLAAQDTFTARLVAGAFTAIMILLVADFVWQVIKVAIDQRIARAKLDGLTAMDEMQRRSRLLTLLPVVRNVLFLTIAVVAVLMALSAVGVEIGPLLAGAGVVGLAVGFGAQTLVKDIISGMFFLLDDAFRVGEYIVSGNFMGTVESFSLRSVKLRHHRGPVFTIPFGVLGSVENMSRDWAIEKLELGITYDSDIEKARKIIKKIGLTLAEDPEFKADVIEPLKMQGVQSFGDFAVKLRLKMMTKPGGQFVMRRRALAMIKQEFDDNGIKFAFPTVTIAGKASDAETAAAQETIARMQKLPGDEPASV